MGGIVEGVVRIMNASPVRDPGWIGGAPDSASSGVSPYWLFNIGNEYTVELLRYIEVLEQCLGKEARMGMLPLQPGDVPDTEADIPDLVKSVGYRPRVSVEKDIQRFVGWYKA